MNQTLENTKWIETIIQDYVDTSPENTLGNENNDKAFSRPLVGFSNGDDPLYEEFKSHVGSFCLTPWELFAVSYREFSVKPKDLSVISWILPHTKPTKKENRKEKYYPSERWARARVFGENFNDRLRKHLVENLNYRGYSAAAPLLTPQFIMRISPKYGYSSTWSERHAAYASGLGTFGLCDGLITPAGKAMRVGSVIAQIRLSPTTRPYSNHNEYCLFFAHGICGKCISRCPVKAITKNGKDKDRCYKHLIPDTQDYVTSHYGFNGHACGLCQTGVPCESKIPKKNDGL